MGQDEKAPGAMTAAELDEKIRQINAAIREYRSNLGFLPPVPVLLGPDAIGSRRINPGTITANRIEPTPRDTVARHVGRAEELHHPGGERCDCGGFTEDEAAERLITAEQARIRELGEAGYVSPFYTGAAVQGLPASMNPAVYGSWRRARTDFVVSFSDADKDKMLSHVTMDSPPLAGDVRDPRAARRQRLAARENLLITVLLIAVMAVSLIIAGISS